MIAPFAIALAIALPKWLYLAGIAAFAALFRGFSVLATPVYLVAAVVLTLFRTKRPAVPLRSTRMFVTTSVVAGLLCFMSIAWSVRGDSAIEAGLTWLALPLLTLFVVNMLLDDGLPSLGKFLAALAPVAVVQALSTVVFRFAPAVEESYYRSSLSTLFIGRLGQDLYTTDAVNNVLNPDRAGGFLFVNLNRASMAMGVMLVAFVAYGYLARKRWVWLAVAPLAAAIVLGGSKTGLALLVLLPLFSLILAVAARSGNPAARMGVVVGGLVIAVVGVQVFFATADDYVNASEATLLPRLQLWGEAIRAIGENLLLGLGFGGWYERWESGGVAIAFSMRPAHNWFLQAWLDAGIAYVAISIVFVVVILIMQLRAVNDARSGHAKFAMAMSGSGFLWVAIHGLGDNSALYGEPPALAFLAVLAALMLTAGRFDSEKRPTLNSRDYATAGSHRRVHSARSESTRSN